MRAAIIAIIMLGCSICFATSDEEIKKRAGENYQSIGSFFTNILLINDMQQIVRDAGGGKPKTEDEAQAKFDSLMILTNKILEEDKKIDESKLNKIYPDWGTNYKTSFVKGVKIFKQGMQNFSKDDLANSDKLFADWDAWWRKNYSKIFLVLNNKFGFEIK